MSTPTGALDPGCSCGQHHVTASTRESQLAPSSLAQNAAPRSITANTPADPTKAESFMTGVAPIGHIPGASCPICWEDLSTHAVELVRCKHRFHSKCALTWFDGPGENHRRCPACRQALFAATQQRTTTSATQLGAPSAGSRTLDGPLHHQNPSEYVLRRRAELDDNTRSLEDRFQAAQSLHHRPHPLPPVSNSPWGSPQPESSINVQAMQATLSNHVRRLAELENHLNSLTASVNALYRAPATQHQPINEPHLLIVEPRTGHHAFVPLSPESVHPSARPALQL